MASILKAERNEIMWRNNRKYNGEEKRKRKKIIMAI
jgi:hypothetical protein